MNLDQAQDVAQRLRDYHNIHEEAANTIGALVAQVDRLQNHIHTCGPNCTKAGCVNAALRAENEKLRGGLQLCIDYLKSPSTKNPLSDDMQADITRAYLLPDERDNLLNGG
jgi:hypothetical protein